MIPVIWNSAFQGHAPVGGFVGSSMLMAMHYGASRAAYSGDIGIGYDSIIQSETEIDDPRIQARMSVFSLLTDTIICTISILVVLSTDLWKVSLKPSLYISKAFAMYIPYSEILIAVILFLAGFTTLIGYLVVGIKAAKFIFPTYGKKLYMMYSLFAFVIFSFFNQNQVILIMSVSGGLLMLTNLVGIIKLRDRIKF
jgi:AGCS family alanine or glycine:cation symporter